MKIRHTAGLAALVTVGVALAGCTAAETPSSGDGTVSGTLTGVFDSNYKGMLDEIIANFEKKYPDVKVDINYQGGSDIANLISTQLQAGTAPDLLLTYPGGEPGPGGSANVVTLASQGALLDLSSSEWAGQVPDVWASDVGYEGKIYAYPGAVQPLAAIYNQDELDALGLTIPTTLDEVYDLCAAATKAGIYAYSQGLGEVTAGPQMLSFAQTSTLVYGPTPDFKAQLDAGTTTYQDSPWVGQFQVYKDMYDKGCFGDGALGRTRQQGAEAVAAGQALAQVDVGGQKVIMEGIAKDGNFVVAPIPATNDGTTYVTALPGYTVAANAKAKNKAAAVAFMDFLAEPDQSVIYANAFSAVPIIPNDAFTAPASLAPFSDAVAAGNYAKLANLGNPTVQTTLNEVVQSLLLGNDTPKSAAEKLQTAFEG